MEIVGRLARTPQRPDRLALLRPDGSVSTWFARDETREDIAAALAKAGMTLRDDGTITREAACERHTEATADGAFTASPDAE